MSRTGVVQNLPKTFRTRFDLGPVGRPKTRRPKAGELTHLSINLDGAVIQALDEAAARLSAERPGPAWTRTDVVREAIRAWLDKNKP